MIGVMAEKIEGELCSGLDLRNFGSWMASEQRRIFLLCRRLLQDADEADSATQDVFLKAYRALLKPEEWRPGPVSRAAVARFMIGHLTDPAFIRQTPLLIA